MTVEIGSLSKLQMVMGAVTLASVGCGLVARYIGLEGRVASNQSRIESIERLNCAIAAKVGVDVTVIDVCNKDDK